MTLAFPPMPAAVEQTDHILVTRLLAEALAMLDDDRSAARLRIQRAYVVSSADTRLPPGKGLLADWQIQRVERFIDDQIDTHLRISDVAARVKLSPSYFSRAFKATKGLSYTDFIIRQRVIRAKQLLLTTTDSIAGIAVACGFADQPHLTRLFRQLTGVTPRAWRRQQHHADLGEPLAV